MKSLAVGSTIAKSTISIRTGSRVSLVEMPAQPTALDIVIQSRNYYKRVYENKDVNKLHLQLCNCINATGKVSYNLKNNLAGFMNNNKKAFKTYNLTIS